MRTVSSANPTARNLDRCSPDGTLPSAMQMTSCDISFRSVYSFSCPFCVKNQNISKIFNTKYNSCKNWFNHVFFISHKQPVIKEILGINITTPVKANIISLPINWQQNDLCDKARSFKKLIFFYTSDNTAHNTLKEK